MAINLARVMKISFCTTCRDRTAHLQQTLPRTLKALREDDELVILDYGSAVPIRSVVMSARHPGLRLYRVSETARFRMAHAKNVAHRLATGDFLVNLDADNFLAAGYVTWLRATLAAGSNVITYSEAWGGGGGRLGLPRAAFVALGGYDERFDGWGFDDDDLLERARRHGLMAVRTPVELVEFIPHDDFLRGADKEATRARAKVLSQAAIAQQHYVANVGREWGVAEGLIDESHN